MRSSQADVLMTVLTLVGAQAFGATYHPVTQTSTNPPPAEANRTFVGWYDRAGNRIFDEFGRRVASQFCDFIVAEWVDASGQIVSPIPRPGAGDFGSYNTLPSAVVNRDGVDVWEMVSEDYAVSASCTFGTAEDAVLRPPHGRVVVDRGTVTIWFDASLSDINLNIYGCSAKESDGSIGQDACGGSAGIYLPEGKTLVLRRVDTTAHKVNIFAQGGNGLNADNGAAGASPWGNDCPGKPGYAGGLGGRGAGSGGAGIGAAGVAGGFGGSGGIGGYREGNSSYEAANSYKDAASGHSGMVGGNMGNLFVFDGITLAANAGVSGSCGTGGAPGHKGGPVTYWGGCGGGGGGGAAGPSARIGGAGSSGGGGGGGGGGHDGGGGGGGGGAGGPLDANETNGGKGAEGCYSDKYVGKDGGRGTFEVGGAGGARGEDTDDPDESGYPGAAGGERPDANGGGGYADLTLENARRDFVSAVLSYPATGDEYKKSGQCPTRGRVIELDAGVGADSLRAEDKQMLAIGDTVAPTPVVVPRRYGQKFCGYFDKDRSEAAQRDVFVFNEFGRLVQGENTSATKLVARWEGLPLVEPLVKLTLVTNNVGDVSAVVKLTVPYAQSVELVVSDMGPQSSGTRTVDKKTDLAAGPHEFTIDLGLNIWDAMGSVEGGGHAISVVYATKRTGDSGFDTSYRQETSVYVAKREVPTFDEATKTLYANGSALDIRRDTRDASKVVVRFDRNRDGIYEGALPRAYSLSGAGCWVNGGFKSKEWAGGAKINFVSGDVWGISVGSNHVGGAAHSVTTGDADNAKLGAGGKEGW